MDLKGYQQYKEQSIATMTQEELLLLLYDELVKRLVQAELALDKKEYPLFEASVQRGIEIIDYLDSTLDRKYEISHSLGRLYEYFHYELGRAKIGRRKEPLTGVKIKAGELREQQKYGQRSQKTDACDCHCAQCKHTIGFLRIAAPFENRGSGACADRKENTHRKRAVDHRHTEIHRGQCLFADTSGNENTVCHRVNGINPHRCHRRQDVLEEPAFDALFCL